MFTIRLNKVNKLGDYDEKYLQAYWGEVEGQGEKPVKFNSADQNISDGAVIEAEERTEKQSKKGTIYYQLRKVKLVERGVVGQYPEAPPQGSVKAPQINIAKYDSEIERMIREIHESVVPPLAPEDNLPDDNFGGEPLSPEDLSSIPF